MVGIAPSADITHVESTDTFPYSLTNRKQPDLRCHAIKVVAGSGSVTVRTKHGTADIELDVLVPGSKEVAEFVTLVSFSGVTKLRVYWTDVFS